MRWTSFVTYLSVVALVGAVISQAFGSTGGRGWFLVVWTVLLLPMSIGLFSHPMRAPAWGVFVGFWGTLAVVALIVLQALALAGVLKAEWTAWPLIVAGIWFVVSSSLGFGAEPFPAVVDVLGVLAGAGLIALGVANLVDDPGWLRAAGGAAALAWVLWACCLGWVFWNMQRKSQRFRGAAVEPRT
jgi:hypothetical protein